MKVRFLSAGDRALVVEFGDRVDRALSERVLRLDAMIQSSPSVGIVETVPSFRSLAIYYDPLLTSRSVLQREIEPLLDLRDNRRASARLWHVPVCYEGEFAPDLAEVARLTRLTPNDVVAAYKLPSSATAGGKIVALIELPSVNALADLNTYRRQFGIPELAACPVDGSGVPKPAGAACFARVGEDGTTGSVSTNDCPGWSGETGLDMDMVSAACPDCSIVLVEAANSNDLDQMNHIAATVGQPVGEPRD